MMAQNIENDNIKIKCILVWIASLLSLLGTLHISYNYYARKSHALTLAFFLCLSDMFIIIAYQPPMIYYLITDNLLVLEYPFLCSLQGFIYTIGMTT